MKRYIEWILTAGLIGVLMYLGNSQFHLKYLKVFIFTLMPMVILLEALFCLTHEKG